jgi:hypothetical protein
MPGRGGNRTYDLGILAQCSANWWLSNTVERIRIVKMVKHLTQSVRTVKWLYGPYEPYGSWKWFTDREPTLSMEMLCSSQGRKVCRSVRIVRSVRTVKWLYGSYFSCPIFHSVNAIITIHDGVVYGLPCRTNIFFLSDCRWLEVVFPLWYNWHVAVC